MDRNINTIDTWLNDPDLSKQRARDESDTRAAVAKCGKPTMVSNGHVALSDGHCSECFRAEIHEVAERRTISELQRWNRLYGRPPTAHDWSLSTLHRYRRQRVLAGKGGYPSENAVTEVERRHREDGPWPSLSAVQGLFGSWSAAIEAAGFKRERREL